MDVVARVDGVVVGSVGRVSVFPVKSTAGHALPSTLVNRRGLLHDREWAAYTRDGGIASGKTTRRFRKVDGLLDWHSTVPVAEGQPPQLHSPTGECYRVDDPAASQALSAAFSQELELRRETSIRHHDECGVHLLTMSSMRRAEQLIGGRVDPLRPRANLVLDTAGTGFLEDDWSGAELAVGPEVVLRLAAGMPRCTMLDQPQHDVPGGHPLLRALGRTHDVLLGLQAQVLHTGTITLGDRVRLAPR
ncbi:MAG: MOSC domain-containing protein [Sciscionella sp.]